MRTQVAAVVIIILQISATIGAGYILLLMLSQALGSQASLNLPLSARLFGSILIAAGVGVGLYTLRYRHPTEMLASTAITLMKFVGRKPIGSIAGRTEPFNPTGPYQYARNPLYFGVVVLAFGLGIAVSSVLLLLWGAVLLCWFWFFLIPFEERELEALFGEDYSRYQRHVPKLLPYRGKYRG